MPKSSNYTQSQKLPPCLTRELIASFNLVNGVPKDENKNCASYFLLFFANDQSMHLHRESGI